jgi:hypothetical protein
MIERPRITRPRTTNTPVLKTLKLASIIRDERAQPRAEILVDRTEDYAEDMARGDTFPPVVVFEDRSGIHLADGFYRCAATEALHLIDIEALVYKGGLRDAILYSVGANADHGTRRSNADKWQAAAKLLQDGEWKQWSDREIAKRCHVTHPFVADVRASLVTVTSDESAEADGATRAYRNRHGGVSRMRTENIGRRQRPPTPTLHSSCSILVDTAIQLGGADVVIAYIRHLDQHNRISLGQFDRAAQWTRRKLAANGVRGRR